MKSQDSLRNSLLQPRGRCAVRAAQLDAELLEGGLQGGLVATEVGRHSIMEQEELLVHDFHLQKCCLVIQQTNHHQHETIICNFSGDFHYHYLIHKCSKISISILFPAIQTMPPILLTIIINHMLQSLKW